MTAHNKGRRPGPKRQLTREQIATLRYLLTQQSRTKELALFETALSTMLRAGDVLQLRVLDLANDPEKGIASASDIKSEADVTMCKTARRARVLITDKAAQAIFALVVDEDLGPRDFLFSAKPVGDPDRQPYSLMTYWRIVQRWAGVIGLQKSSFATHSLRRTRAALYYAETGDIRAVQIMLGHRNISATQRYLGIEEDDALERFRKVEV